MYFRLCVVSRHLSMSVFLQSVVSLTFLSPYTLRHVAHKLITEPHRSASLLKSMSVEAAVRNSDRLLCLCLWGRRNRV